MEEQLYEARPVSEAFEILKELVARDEALPPEKRTLNIQIDGNRILVPTTPERILELYRKGELVRTAPLNRTGKGQNASQVAARPQPIRQFKSQAVIKLKEAIEGKDFSGITDTEVAVLEKYFRGGFAIGSRPKGGEIADYNARYKSAINKLMKERSIEPLPDTESVQDDFRFDASTLSVTSKKTK